MKIKKERLNHKKIRKMEIFNEKRSKVGIENMFYKDSAPAIILILYKNEFTKEKIQKFLQNFYKNDENVAFIQKKAFYFIFDEYKNTDKIIDFIKIADCVVFDIFTETDEHKDSLDLEIFETLAMINAHGQSKICFISSSTDRKLLKKFTKQIREETGTAVKILNLNVFKLFLSKFKIRPIEFKCNNSFVIVEEIEGNVIRGRIRGKPIKIEQENVFIVGKGEFKLKSLKYVETGDVFNKIKKNEVTEADEEEIEENDFNFGEEDSKHSLNESISVDSEQTEISDVFDYESKEETENVKNNFLMETKSTNKRAFEIKNKMLREQNFVLPGDIVEITLETNINKNDIFAFEVEKGNLSKNEFYCGDIAINKHYNRNIKELNNLIANDAFISIGWHKIKFDTKNMKLSNKDTITDNLNRMGTVLNIKTEYNVENANWFLYTTNNVNFRVLGSGKFLNTQELYFSYNLIGYPEKINVNTVTVKNMFTSRKECSKFLYAKLITESGLRGILKTAIGAGGDFRATFEGNILLSDIVYLNVREKYSGKQIKFKKTVDEEFVDVEEKPADLHCSYLHKLENKLNKQTKQIEVDSAEEFERLLQSTETEEEVVQKRYVDQEKRKKENEERRRINALKHVKKTKKKHRMNKRQKAK